ncbi:MAG: HlyD family type I secretion periplasmic adaptor subunit [Gammaproteobacteria bacterium]|nr:HlyD family type I secretion periplasmic adaptor subunit [Gammaproteobacteria bacterium]
MSDSEEDVTQIEDVTQFGAYGKSDQVYMRSLSAAVVHRSPKYMQIIVLIMALFVFAAITWMSWAEIDVVIRGSGKVSPASQVQLVQSLEGGIVSEILVSEGQLVEANQPLLKINDIAFASSFEENRLTYLELLARYSRLHAEAFDKEFQANEEVTAGAPRLNHSEKSLFDSNRQQLEDSLSILEEQIRQQQNSVREAQSRERQIKRSLGLVQKEIKIKLPLKERGIISEVEFLQLQQREAEMEGELESAQIVIPRLQSEIEEARLTKQKEQLNFRNEAKRELNEISSEVERIRETQTALSDRVKRTTLRSPVNGIIKRLYANSIGGVISPGNDIVEIVPKDDSLLVEVEIKPADIASVNVDQLARLKFSAYDFAVHGSLPGKVLFVSADTVTNERDESFFIVRIKPSKDHLGPDSKPLPIKVGMTVEADIITAKKTILDFLLFPVHRGLDKALRER